MALNSVFLVASLITSVVNAVPLLQERQAPNGVPDYVMRYAPVVWLHSDEKWWPGDINQHLTHTNPEVNFNVVSAPSNPLTTNDLGQMGGDVSMTSKDDITKSPSWLYGVRPNDQGLTEGAKACTVIVVDHGNGNVDAVYNYFYNYNYGGDVVGWKKLNFGNHVGDWEQNMVRFSNGNPTAVWYSQHSWGEAFTYDAVNKEGNRPVSYAAYGTHANYAITGNHDHVIPNFNLPFGALQDYTNKGRRWDPVANAYFYKLDTQSGQYSTYDGDATPLSWMNFAGHFGDQEYPPSDSRQFKIFGQAKYVTGPTGPRDKQPNRLNVCPPDAKNTCIIRPILMPKKN